MSLTTEQRSGLNVALNEADLLGVEVDLERRVGAATFAVLSLPESGPVPDDRRVQFLFGRIGRVAVSVRNGRWDDPTAEVVPLSIDELLPTVQSFGGLPIYGWEFIDCHAKGLASWGKRLSLDWTSGDDGLSHSITVFQDSEDRILELCVWFDQLAIRSPRGADIPIDSFVASGKRWWDAFYAGDERTRGFGMAPLGGPTNGVGGNGLNS